MPLAVFTHGDSIKKLGKVIGETIIDLSIAAPDLPDNVIGFLSAGETSLAIWRAVGPDAPGALPLSAVRLHAPVPNPEKYLAIGVSYADHADEATKLGLELPDWQIWFNKQVSSITGPFDKVIAPRVSAMLDYEAELAVVIGRICRYATPEEAPSFVGGYMVANDVSARDWQFRTGTMTLGKSFDTHGPIGPWLTLAEEVPDPHDLDLAMIVNGEERQRTNTSKLTYNIWEQISYLSQAITLKPGDILATGTPGGVGLVRTPPTFLQPGDIMRVEISGLGHIENRVEAES